MNRSICCEQNEASEVIHAYYTSSVYTPDRIWFYEREYIIQINIHIYVFLISYMHFL